MFIRLIRNPQKGFLIEDLFCVVPMHSYNVVIVLHGIGPFDTYEI